MKRKRACTCLLCAAALFVLVAIGVGVFFWRMGTKSSRKLADAIAAIQARGEPVSAAELNQPPVPDQENAAVLLQAAFSRLSGAEPAKLLTDLESPDPRDWPDSSVEGLRTWTNNEAKALELVHEALQRPKCRLPVDYSQGLDAPFPHLRQLRTLARLVAGSASVNVMDGHWEAAARDVADGLALGDCLEREPVLIGKLTQYAVYAVALRPTQSLLSQPELPPDALSTLASALDKSSQATDLHWALVGERALALDAFEKMREGKLWVGQLGQPQASPPKGRGRYPEWLLVPDETFYLEQMELLIELSDQSYCQSGQGLTAWEAQAQNSATRFPPKPLSATILPIFSRAAAKRDGCLARIEAARGAVAVRQRYLRTQHLPAQLEDLVPIELPEVPIDPFSGKPLQYRVHADKQGFIVYSAGQNMTDDSPAQAGGGGDDIVVTSTVR